MIDLSVAMELRGDVRLNLARAGGLDESVRMYGKALILCLAYYGFGRVQVLDVRRTLAEQERLYGKGRTRRELEQAGVDPGLAKPGERQVTWTLPRESMHVRGRAMDISMNVYTEKSRGRVVDIARGLGWTWGGEWGVVDKLHFEIRR